MKTLVIHPSDRTTDFLKPIYAGKGFTVLDDNITRDKIIKGIHTHDRIIMLGHGCPQGLFSGDASTGFGGLVIDPKTSKILQDKECVAIWCNADQYMNKYMLKGFYTGMFISEVAEAEMFNVPATADQVKVSNDTFAVLVGMNIDKPDLKDSVHRLYNGSIPVMKYNRARLYERKPKLKLEDHG